MGIKRPFSSRMLSGDSQQQIVEPDMNHWLYTPRINESGDNVNTLYFYNNAVGPAQVIVPNKNTELQDYQKATRPYNNAYANLPFYNHTTIRSIDLQNVPFRNNSMANAFYDCRNLVSVSNIPEGVTNMRETFSGCNNFNQPVTIPEGVTNMSYTFSGCNNFNQPVTIPEGVTDMYYTFNGCRNFNQPVTIPNSVTSMRETFRYCSNFNQPIIIQSTQINNAVNCFYNTTLNKNVYIPLNGNLGGESMVNHGSYIRYYYSSNSTINIWSSDISGAELFTRDTTNDRVFKSVQYYAWTNFTENVTCYTNVETPVNRSTYPFIYYNFPQNISLTYQSFRVAGYSTATRKDGVLLRALNSLP